MKEIQRIISGWLVFCLLLTMLPLQVFSVETQETEPAAEMVVTAETAGSANMEEVSQPPVPETVPAVTEEMQTQQISEEETAVNQPLLAASGSVITTEEAFSLIAQNPSGTYTLGADLTLGADTVKALQNCYFTGNLDGDGHSIGFSIRETVNNACGLFSGINGTVQNLNLVGTIILDSGITVNEVGLLAGNFGADAYIYNCTAGGSITVADPAADSYPIIGGMIGNGSGRVETCKSTVTISLTSGGPGEIGGLVGAMYAGQIADSHYAGAITLEQTGYNANYYSVTGLTNTSNADTADGCSVSGTITAKTTDASGRVIGVWNANNSYNNAAVHLTTQTGSISCAGVSGGGKNFNTGSVTLVTTGATTAYAYGMEGVTGGVNSGTVSADAQIGSITASGLSQCTDCTNEAGVTASNAYGAAFAGGAIIAGEKNINRGTVQATAVKGVAMAKGVNGSGSVEDCLNSGAVSATATESEARAYGIDGCSNSENTGDVAAYSLGETSSNSSASGASGNCVTNRGSIFCEAPEATGIPYAYGIQGADSIYSRNYGKVEATAGNSHAIAKGVEGDFCENYGEVKASSTGPNDADRGSATAYGTSEKGSYSYNTAMVMAVSGNSAARAYGAGDTSSVSDGTAYASSEYYEVVTENGNTVYKMGYAYAGSSLNATAEIAGTAVTSSSGEGGKYIYFFMPADSCETHAADAAPCLTVESLDCGCYHAAGEAASSEKKDYTSQIPTPDDGEEDEEEEPFQVEIKDYLDNSAIEINYAGSAYAYYISEPDCSFIYTADGKAGSVRSTDKGVILVPLGTFREQGTHTVPVVFTYADGKKLEPEVTFNAKVKVTSLEFTQDWTVSLDGKVGAKLSAGAGVKLGPVDLKATLGQVEAEVNGGGTVKVSRSYTEDGETLELSTDDKMETGISISSGVTGEVLKADFNIANLEASVKGALTGIYGIRIDNFSMDNPAHRLAIAAYLLDESLRTRPNYIFMRPFQQQKFRSFYTGNGCTAIMGSGVELGASSGASLGAVEVNEIDVFSCLDADAAVNLAYSSKDLSAGGTERTVSWKSGKNLSAYSANVPGVNLGGRALGREFLGRDIEISAKNGPDGKTLESTSLAAYDSESVYLTVGEHTTAEYDKYVFRDYGLSEVSGLVAGIGNYTNGNSNILALADLMHLGEYISVSSTPVAYQRETKDHLLYSLPFDFGATLFAGIDLGATLSYQEDVGYTHAAGFAVEDKILLTAESEELKEEVEEKKFRLEDAMNQAMPALWEAAANFFEQVVGSVKDGVRHSWAWVTAKADSTADWLVSITAAPSENEGAWAQSTDISVTKPGSGTMALRQTIYEADETEGLVAAATVGRPFVVRVTNSATNAGVTDLTQDPLLFTIRYAAEDLKAAGIDAGSGSVGSSGLAMYRYSDSGDYFDYVGGVVDESAMTVTATIVQSGQYTLAVDTCAPRLTKLDVSGFHGTPTITACVDDPAGMDLEGFRFEIDGSLKVDGQTAQNYFDRDAGVFTYTVPSNQALTEGDHTISFTLQDFAGNRDTYVFEFAVDLTAPVISETTMTGSANTGDLLEIRTHVSDTNLSAVYAMLSRLQSDGTWSEEVRCDMGDMGNGIWGLDYEGEGSSVRVRIVAEDTARNTAETDPNTVAGRVLKTAREAVAEMTWGVNLADLYIADLDRPEGSTTGYIDFEPAAELGMALWFWNYDFHWLAQHGAQRGTFSVSAPFPAFVSATAWTGDLFRIGVMTRSTDRTISVTLKDSKIVKSNGKTIALPSMDKTYTGQTAEGPDINGWCTYSINCPPEAPEENAALNGATFYTTVTIEEASHNLASKADYYYQYQRYPMDREALTNVFLRSGANVIRLPVSWTAFVNDTTFEIDREWLDAVKQEVDYILSQGAYCVLNMHGDYLQRAFVGTKQNGAWTNLHWERDWMEAQYAEYVDERFAAVWTQIAEYFKDYPDRLIFETCNEPTMEWYSGVNYDPWINAQAERVNELNSLFVETVRNTGGENASRILCLAVAEYNQHQRLSQVDIPENDDYLMVQIHSYNEMENDPNSGSNQSGYDYRTATDALFADVADFREKHPDVPVIIGEVGITHRESDAVQAPKVDYFFRSAKAQGVPCLWWEDYFVVDNMTQYWLYDKRAQEWGRPEILKAIQNNAGAGVPVYAVKCGLSENGTVSAKPAGGLVWGDAVTLTVTPSSGYRLETLVVDGADVTSRVSANCYTFTMPARNVTVTAVFTQIPPEHVHSYTQKVTPATCTKEGYTTYTCTCGDSYVGQKVAAKGHGYDDAVDGTCNACGVNRETVETRKVVHMFRLYNPNTGEHFYTGSEEEKSNLTAVGWQYEGVGFTFPANTGAPVHRLFQTSTGEHLYTMDEAEKAKLMSEGWNYEGIAFNSAYNTEAVQHRLHNPNATVGAYHFTFSEEEKQNLINVGWEYQGIGWYSCWK